MPNNTPVTQPSAVGDITTTDGDYPTFLTLEQVGDILGVSKHMVRGLVARGRLDAVRLGHRTVRVSKKSLDDLLAEVVR